MSIRPEKESESPEMRKNFGAARLRKIANDNGGRDDEPTYDGMNDAETTGGEATLKRNIETQMKAAAITTESAATDVVHEAEETNDMDDQEAKDHLLSQKQMDLALDSLKNPQPQPQGILLGESSNQTHTYQLYSKGLVSGEIIENVTMQVGGSGLYLCDSNGNSKFLEANKVLRKRALAYPKLVAMARSAFHLTEEKN